jgi:hypothetical protein
MRRIALSVFFLVFWPTVTPAQCPASGSVVELFGTIGKDLSISMNLTFQKDRLSGSYAYVKYEKKIPLTGTCTGGSLTLQESDASGKPTGTFRGSFTTPQAVEGTWSTPDGKKSLPFNLVAAPRPTTPKVGWTKLVGISSLQDIDGQLAANLDELVEVEVIGGKGGRATIRNCLDYLALTANGGDVAGGGRDGWQIVHSDFLICHTLQLLKNARPAQTSFLGDFKFTKNAINILSPRVALLSGNLMEAETAEKKGLSLEQFDPSLKVTDMQEDRLSVETETWEAHISYLARGDFDGKGFEEVLIEREGHFKEVQGSEGGADSLFILTRTTNSGPLKVVRELR